MARRRTEFRGIRFRDDRGALEGLPLQLIILVVIAAIAIGIIVAWFAVFQKADLARLELAVPDRDSIGSSTDAILYKTWDSKGNLLNGVTVVLTGCGLNNVRDTTRSYSYKELNDTQLSSSQATNNAGNGLALLNSLKPKWSLPGGLCTVSVSATYSGGSGSRTLTDSFVVS